MVICSGCADISFHKPCLRSSDPTSWANYLIRGLFICDSCEAEMSSDEEDEPFEEEDSEFDEPDVAEFLYRLRNNNQ